MNAPLNNASGLPITQLGSTIKAHMSAGEKYEDKAEQHFKSAGMHLLEAKARIAAGEYGAPFGAFISKECGGLSSSRAYELIAIANGTKTVESIRAEKAASVRKCREQAAAASSPLRSGQQRTQRSAPPKQPPAAKSPNESLIQQLNQVCEGLTAEQIRSLINSAKAFGMETEELPPISKKPEPSMGAAPDPLPILDADLQTLAELVAELVHFVHGTRTSPTCSTPLSNELAISLLITALNQ
jgi:hypothetical protein